MPSTACLGKYDAMAISWIDRQTQLDNFIENRWVKPVQGKYIDSIAPATGNILLPIADSDGEDIHFAVKAARSAFPAWQNLGTKQRSHFLLQIADGIQARLQEFAELESLDQGKPVWLAQEMDIPRAIHNFRFFAEEILRPDEEIYLSQKFKSRVYRKPVGVAGLISPWNLPLYLLTWKIAPAIAFGNTVVCKPSELTSLTAGLLAEVLQEVGLPPGVVNFVFGRGAVAGEALVKHPQVPLISFTGGTATGRRIYRESAEHFKKLSLELGGKNPNVIFADADLEKAVAGTLRSSFLNQGEICLCGSRIYVEKSISEQFIEKFISEVQKIKVGDPRDPSHFLGALVSREHLEKVQNYIEIAKSEGGKILIGGTKPLVSAELQGGYYLNPTIITGLPENSRCIQEEIFGPVVTISVFDHESQAIDMANNVVYGLSATLWTEDSEKANRVAESLEAGTVWVNSWLLRDLRVPFGGMKHSGLGREGGKYSKDFFTETVTIVEVNK